MDIRVYALPTLVGERNLEGAAAVVIDALRMTSVAAAALARGCAGVMAAAETDEAREVAKAHGALLGGERNAVAIPGFDFSNSPREYTVARVRGRRLVMTTTNGTRAILAAKGAGRVLLGAFVNAYAVAEAIRGQDRLAFVPAGTNGAFSLEDGLAAGAVIARLEEMGEAPRLDDMAQAMRRLYEGARGDLHAALSATGHYARLKALGLEEDLRFCLREDILPVAPERGADGWFT